MADIFPEDILYGILSRLPVKSLARFRCVCKLWSKYINDPYLRTIHVKEEPTQIMFQQFGEFPHRKIKISFLRGVQKDPVLELCYKGKGPNDGHLLLGSCNGLILVSYEQDPCDAGTYGFAVIDPLSKRRHDLPPISIKIRPNLINSGSPCDAAGIAFDDSTNTLKTVFSILKNPYKNVCCTMVHSPGMSSWRKIAQTPAYPISGEGVFGHGRLHWLTGAFIDGRKIVWFDVRTEEFGLTGPPEPDGIDDYIQLADLNGEVGFVYVEYSCIKMWILKSKEEWVLHCCFDLSLIPPQCYDFDVEVLGCWNKEGDVLLDVLGCWNKEGDVLMDYDKAEWLFVYILRTGDLRQVHEQRDGCVADIRMYRSSLFSLRTSAYSIKNC